MRLGTQTLIQALQALPWMTGSDDENTNDPGTESEDEDRPQCEFSASCSAFCMCQTISVERLSSSIHTIHRPLARFNRRNIPIPSKPSSKRNGEDLLEDISASDDEIENDFEANMPPHNTLSSPIPLKDGLPHNPFEAMRERAGSMATIRLHRRTRLAEKLKEVYDLEDVREVWAGTS
jgi:sterol 3beta-glucosyltransferase